MSIGHTTGHAAHTPDMKKENPTEEEKTEAKVSSTSTLPVSIANAVNTCLHTIKEEN